MSPEESATEYLDGMLKAARIMAQMKGIRIETLSIVLKTNTEEGDMAVVASTSAALPTSMLFVEVLHQLGYSVAQQDKMN